MAAGLGRAATMVAVMEGAMVAVEREGMVWAAEAEEAEAPVAPGAADESVAVKGVVVLGRMVAAT
eukprot:2483240-Prymnesium_polylepis.1